MKGRCYMKKKVISFVSVGLVAVVVVLISDIVSLSALGSFAWVSFILWNYTAKTDDQVKKTKLLLRMILGLPIGLVLAICMIHIPSLFGNNIIVKYLITFLCNGIAVLFPSSMVPGIFFGIGLTFSGLGVGLVPDSIENALIILGIMAAFATIGMSAAWLTAKLQKISK